MSKKNAYAKKDCKGEARNLKKNTQVLMWAEPTCHTPRRVTTQVSLMPSFWSTYKAPRSNQLICQTNFVR